MIFRILTEFYCCGLSNDTYTIVNYKHKNYIMCSICDDKNPYNYRTIQGDLFNLIQKYKKESPLDN